MNDKCRFDEPNSLNQKKVPAVILGKFSIRPTQCNFSLCAIFLQPLAFKSNIREFFLGSFLWVNGERSGGVRGEGSFELLLIFTLVSFPFHPLCLRRSFQRSPSRNVWLLSSSFQSTLTPNTGVCVFAFKCPTETTLNCLKTIFLLRFSNRCH